MAIIYSYPEGTPTVTDTVLGTIYDANGNTLGNPTRSFAIQDIINLIPPGAQGPTGATGPQGPTGQAGATGPSGSQGIPGPIGPAGLNWQGQWVSGGSYVLNDAVGYNGASWFCVLAISGGILSPPSDPTHWALLASQGAPGPQGPIGATGPGGALGPVGPAGPAGPAGTVGISSLNGLTDATQLFAVGTTGTDFNIVSSLNTHTFNVPNASLIARGFVSTVTQTFAGNKTFDNNVFVIGAFNLYDTTAAGYGFIGLNNNQFTVIGANSNQLFYADSVGIVQFNNGVNTQTLDFSGVTTRSYIFPNLDGTIALTSDIPAIGGFVPYTGATANLNMGSFLVQALEYKFFDPSYSVYGRLFLDSEEFRFMTTPTTTLATINYGQLLLQGISAYNATITYTTLTTNRTYALPNASGTIALTSNIPSLAGFVPYIGATQGLNLGAFNLTATSIIKAGGTAGQYLMADGSISTGPVLTGFVPYTGATGAVNLGSYDLTVNGLTAGRGGNNVATNTVFGVSAGINNISGQNNTYIGANAGEDNDGGTYNTAIGSSSLIFSTTGNSNTAVGLLALFNNTTGSFNTAIGANALSTNTVGIENIAIGTNAQTLNPNDNNSIIIGYSATGAGPNTVVLGNNLITTTRLRGAVQGLSFVKDTGTVYETLLANGSVSTNGTLYKATTTTYPIVSGSTQVYSAVIPGNIWADGDNFKINTVTTTTATSLANVITQYYINTNPTLVGATQIAQYSGPLGSLYYPMDRTYWVSSGNFYGRNFTNTTSSSSNASNSALNSTGIPLSFYIIVQITTTGTDLATLSSLQISKS